MIFKINWKTLVAYIFWASSGGNRFPSEQQTLSKNLTLETRVLAPILYIHKYNFDWFDVTRVQLWHKPRVKNYINDHILLNATDLLELFHYIIILHHRMHVIILHRTYINILFVNLNLFDKFNILLFCLSVNGNNKMSQAHFYDIKLSEIDLDVSLYH